MVRFGLIPKLFGVGKSGKKAPGKNPLALKLLGKISGEPKGFALLLLGECSPKHLPDAEKNPRKGPSGKSKKGEKISLGKAGAFVHRPEPKGEKSPRADNTNLVGLLSEIETGSLLAYLPPHGGLEERKAHLGAVHKGIENTKKINLLEHEKKHKGNPAGDTLKGPSTKGNHCSRASPRGLGKHGIALNLQQAGTCFGGKGKCERIPTERDERGACKTEVGNLKRSWKGRQHRKGGETAFVGRVKRPAGNEEREGHIRQGDSAVTASKLSRCKEESYGILPQSTGVARRPEGASVGNHVENPAGKKALTEKEQKIPTMVQGSSAGRRTNLQGQNLWTDGPSSMKGEVAEKARQGGVERLPRDLEDPAEQKGSGRISVHGEYRERRGITNGVEKTATKHRKNVQKGVLKAESAQVRSSERGNKRKQGETKYIADIPASEADSRRPRRGQKNPGPPLSQGAPSDLSQEQPKKLNSKVREEGESEESIEQLAQGRDIGKPRRALLAFAETYPQAGIRNEGKSLLAVRVGRSNSRTAVEELSALTVRARDGKSEKEALSYDVKLGEKPGNQRLGDSPQNRGFQRPFAASRLSEPSEDIGVGEKDGSNVVNLSHGGGKAYLEGRLKIDGTVGVQKVLSKDMVIRNAADGATLAKGIRARIMKVELLESPCEDGPHEGGGTKTFISPSGHAEDDKGIKGYGSISKTLGNNFAGIKGEGTAKKKEGEPESVDDNLSPGGTIGEGRQFKADMAGKSNQVLPSGKKWPREGVMKPAGNEGRSDGKRETRWLFQKSRGLLADWWRDHFGNTADDKSANAREKGGKIKNISGKTTPGGALNVSGMRKGMKGDGKAGIGEPLRGSFFQRDTIGGDKGSAWVKPKDMEKVKNCESHCSQGHFSLGDGEGRRMTTKGENRLAAKPKAGDVLGAKVGKGGDMKEAAQSLRHRGDVKNDVGGSPEGHGTSEQNKDMSEARAMGDIVDSHRGEASSHDANDPKATSPGKAVRGTDMGRMEAAPGTDIALKGGRKSSEPADVVEPADEEGPDMPEGGQAQRGEDKAGVSGRRKSSELADVVEPADEEGPDMPEGGQAQWGEDRAGAAGQGNDHGNAHAGDGSPWRKKGSEGQGNLESELMRNIRRVREALPSIQRGHERRVRILLEPPELGSAVLEAEGSDGEIRVRIILKLRVPPEVEAKLREEIQKAVEAEGVRAKSVDVSCGGWGEGKDFRREPWEYKKGWKGSFAPMRFVERKERSCSETVEGFWA